MAKIKLSRNKKVEKVHRPFRKDLIVKLSIISLVVLATIGVVLVSVYANINAINEDPSDTLNSDLSSNYVILNLGDTISCEPCRKIRLEINALEVKYQGEILIRSYNIYYDAEGVSLANQYNIATIPTLVFLENGVEVHRTLGYKSQEQIEADLLILGWI